MCRSVDDLSDLLVRVVTIGYEKQGESIVLLLIDNKKDKVLYSMVIDSYKRHNQNRTLEILQENNVTSLDILCWTHPDSDHSRGLTEILDNYCNSSTRIITPICFWSEDYSVKAFNPNRREKDFILEVKKLNKDRKCKHHKVAVARNGYACPEDFIIDSPVEEIRCKLIILSPFDEELSATIDSYLEDPDRNPAPKRNQTSVSIVFEVGPYRMLFAADTPNAEIEMMNKEQIDRPIFIKIPHHGSDSSQRLLDYIFPNSNTLACTTVFKSTKAGSNLPHAHVLSKYSDLCEVVCCTGSDPTFNSSLIRADFDFWGKKACNVYLEGSAHVVAS